MAQLRLNYQEFIKRDTEVIIVGPDGPAAFKRTWEMEDMPMVGLADPGSKVADRYHQKINLLKWGRMPALVIVDKSGFIRFLHYGNSMSDIPTNEHVLKTLDEINSA
jgi:peroxiredoxin Q/BCP